MVRETSARFRLAAATPAAAPVPAAEEPEAGARASGGAWPGASTKSRWTDQIDGSICGLNVRPSEIRIGGVDKAAALIAREHSHAEDEAFRTAEIALCEFRQQMSLQNVTTQLHDDTCGRRKATIGGEIALKDRVDQNGNGLHRRPHRSHFHSTPAVGCVTALVRRRREMAGDIRQVRITLLQSLMKLCKVYRPLHRLKLPGLDI